MVRRQTLIVFAAAAFFGLVAVYLVNIFLSGAEQQQTAAVQTTKVAVARIPLEFGTRLTPQNVSFVDWPVSSVPEGSFRGAEELNPMGQTHVVLRPIEPGEPILRSKLSGEGGRATLSALLPADMRAMAIRISDVAGVAGFALPGDRVDVLITRAVGEEQVTDVLLQNVRIIAIDQDANDNSEQPTLGKTATLEVAPEDAQRLTLGQAVGTLSLALRSVAAPQDGIAYASAVGTGELGSGYGYAPRLASYEPSAAARPPRIMRRRSAAPAAPPPPATSSIEVVRGTAGTNYEVRPYKGS